jgi:23S rRNA pseudouridine2605 synthase
MKTIRHNTGKNGQKRPFEKQKGNANFQGKDTPIRLNKYIAYTGLCSRRDADELIKTGKISVNGKIVTEMGIKVDLNDIVKYKGEKLRKESKVYILLNKPRDYITTMDDPKNRKTVNDLRQKYYRCITAYQ